MQLFVLVGTHRRVAGRLLPLLDKVDQLGDGDSTVLGFERVLESLVGPGPEGSELDEFLIALHGSVSSVFIHCCPAATAAGARHWTPIAANPC